MKRTLNGISYSSSIDAYRQLNPPTNVKAFSRRYNRGEDYPYIMRPTNTLTTHKPPININGVVYATLKEAYTQLSPSMAYTTFVKRYRHGLRGTDLVSKHESNKQ